MFLTKSKPLKVSPEKLSLDQFLWFVENYFPNKKNRTIRKELFLDALEAETINQIQKSYSLRYKSMLPTATNKKLSFNLVN